MVNQTLSEQIYDELYQDIIYQRLVCGQKLTLKVLKDRFNVSHTPIREALFRLSENGLVTYYSNCGVTVTEYTEEEIRQLYQFAAELDAMAVTFCQNNYNRIPLLLDLKENIETAESLLKEERNIEWKKYSEEFHKIFYRHANNYYLDESAAKLRARLEVLSCMYYKNQNVEKIHKGHVAIYHKVKEGDFLSASNLMREHLQYDMVYALKAYAEYQSNHHS